MRTSLGFTPWMIQGESQKVVSFSFPIVIVVAGWQHKRCQEVEIYEDSWLGPSNSDLTGRCINQLRFCAGLGKRFVRQTKLAWWYQEEVYIKRCDLLARRFGFLWSLGCQPTVPAIHRSECPWSSYLYLACCEVRINQVAQILQVRGSRSNW
jgi:hypothetical protein